MLLIKGGMKFLRSEAKFIKFFETDLLLFIKSDSRLSDYCSFVPVPKKETSLARIFASRVYFPLSEVSEDACIFVI